MRLQSVILAILFLAQSLPSIASGPSQWVEANGLRYPYRLDFGDLSVAEPSQQVLEFESLGPTPLFVASLEPSCGCTVVDWSARTLMPGQRARATVDFDGETKPGHTRRTLTIRGANGLALGRVLLTVDVVEEHDEFIALQPQSVDVGRYELGSPIRFQIRATNQGPASAQLTHPDPIELATQDSHTIDVAILPDSEFLGSVTVLETEKRAYRVPVRGYPQLTTQAYRWDAVDCEVSPVGVLENRPYVDFGELSLGEAGQQPITVITGSNGLTARLVSTRENIQVEPAELQLGPNESAIVTLTSNGLDPVGSFRHFVFVSATLSDGTSQRVRLGCHGLVANPRSRPADPSVGVLRWSNQGRDTFTVTGNGERHTFGAPSFERGQSVRPLTLGACDMTIVATPGDETVMANEVSWLAGLEDPASLVLRAWQGEHAGPGLRIALVADDMPLASDLASRAMGSGLLVLTRTQHETATLDRIRDVLIWSPSVVDDDPLTLYVKSDRILSWEFNPIHGAATLATSATP